VDEARIEDETVVKPTVSNSSPVELGTRRLVRTFGKRLIRERGDRGHMTSITIGFSQKRPIDLAASERCIECFSPTPIPNLIPNKR
jgi:hypothetical protein